MTHIATIDCGTNTIRSLIAETHRDDSGRPRLKVLRRRNEIIRLGQGVDCTGLLNPEALERTLAAVVSYTADCTELGVVSGGDVRRLVVTSATRDARNREDFMAGVRRLLGIDPEVANDQEEARLFFTGLLLGAGEEEGTPEPGECEPAPRLVVGLGGSSTELILGVDEPSAAINLDTGSVRITERFLAAGVIPETEVTARAEVRGLLDEAERVVNLSAPGRLVGLIGTITTVTAHALNLQASDPQTLNGVELSLQVILAPCEVIVHSMPEQRVSWGYLAPGCHDVITAGVLVWNEVVTRVMGRAVAVGRPLARVTTSLYDILDGITLSLVPESGPVEGTPARMRRR